MIQTHSREALDRAAEKKQVRRRIEILDRFQVEFEQQGLPPPGVVTEFAPSSWVSSIRRSA